MMKDSTTFVRCKKELEDIMAQPGIREGFPENYIGGMYWWGKDSIHTVDYFRKAYERGYHSPEHLISAQLDYNINIEECLRLSEYALEEQPGSAVFLRLKGLSLHKLGRHREALTFLREADEKTPGNPKIKKEIQDVERALALQ